MNPRVKLMNKSRDIELQKKHFKGAADSLCRKCSNFELDCFDVDKQCGSTKDKSSSGWSRVTKCNAFNKPIKRSYSENTISVQAATDSRIDSMGGGFQNIEKYKK